MTSSRRIGRIAAVAAGFCGRRRHQGPGAKAAAIEYSLAGRRHRNGGATPVAEARRSASLSGCVCCSPASRSQHDPMDHRPGVSATLTTTTFNRSSLRWLEIST
jgi:hypothetical protein